MLVTELAAMVHENAVEHGWYEGKALAIEDFMALIHSEWSETLEEAREGRPLVYGLVVDGEDNATPRLTEDWQEIINKHLKPEGCAVELADGCLRILDLLGYGGVKIEPIDGAREPEMEDLTGIYSMKELSEMPGEDEVPKLVTWLHAATSEMILDAKNDDYDLNFLMVAMSMALLWIQQRGIDPIKLLLMKHEYNKSRPYKHGNKKF